MHSVAGMIILLLITVTILYIAFSAFSEQCFLMIKNIIFTDLSLFISQRSCCHCVMQEGKCVVVGLVIIYTLDEVAFIQNLVFYIQSAYRTPVSLG